MVMNFFLSPGKRLDVDEEMGIGCHGVTARLRLNPRQMCLGSLVLVFRADPYNSHQR